MHDIPAFREIILDYYGLYGRCFPWRETRDPYRILVSEFMLQQTQTQRVIRKYEAFLEKLPDFASLSAAPLDRVLSLWQGLGYNRRAVALKQTAGIVMEEHGGVLPSDAAVLRTFPGIGPATSSEIAVFAFNVPQVFIETNIRRVFIHFFFQDRNSVDDSDILPLAEQALGRTDPRTWYYALMDYGAMLKKSVPNPNRRSAHYKKQSPFEGSDRQVRGTILRILLREPWLGKEEIAGRTGFPVQRVEKILPQLEKEGFVSVRDDRYAVRGE